MRPAFAAAAFLVLLSGCVSTSPSAPCDDPQSGTLVRVLDGDTFEILMIGSATAEQIRLVGINTPEMGSGDEPDDCLAVEARDELELLLSGEDLQICTDEEELDRYGRTLGYVYIRENGTFVNQLMVERGYACSYPFPPNTLHLEALDAAEAEARSAALGVWGLCPSGCGVP